jgi:uncharacterized membrane protein YhaH (DUF805 family)
MSEEATKSPGWLAALLWNLLFVIVVNAGLIGINHWMMPYSSGGTLFLGWVVCVILVVVAAAWISKRLGDKNTLFISVILFAVFDLLYGAVGGHLPVFLGIRETQVISVKDADRSPDNACDVFHFSDGKVSLRHAFTRKYQGKRGTLCYHVAPVVPGGWQESDPVTLWVAEDGSNEAAPGGWRKDFRGGYSAAAESNFRELIQVRAAANHLVTSPGAPVIYWREHPREALLAQATFELWGLLGVDFIVLASPLLPLLRRRGAKTPRK